MINALCIKCLHRCKQDESAKIMQCPKFQKRLSDDEFRDLIDELKKMDSEVTNLKKRTEALIEKALLHEDRGDGDSQDNDEDETDNDIEKNNE